MLVVLTGAEGRIGSGFRDEYLSNYASAYDLRLAVHPEDFTDDRFDDVVRFDLAEPGSVRAALRGCDAVIHLAGNADQNAAFDDLLTPNLIGTWNVLEAARLEGLRRVVYASSIHAIMGYPLDRQAREFDRPLPDTVYGATKVWGEALCGFFAVEHGLSCIALRIGGYVADERAEELRRDDNPQLLDIVITQRDMAQILHLAVTAPDTVKFEVLHALSDNRWKRMDLARAREVLGYAPQDDSFELSRVVGLGEEKPV
jgi:uronate dehydrogenase